VGYIFFGNGKAAQLGKLDTLKPARHDLAFSQERRNLPCPYAASCWMSRS